MEIEIETNTYKKIKYKIKFVTGDDGGSLKDKFTVYGDFPWSSNLTFKNIEDLRQAVKKDIDNWYQKQPNTEDDWVSLVEDCVIQDHYESWHVDKTMIMEVLKRYSKFKSIV